MLAPDILKWSVFLSLFQVGKLQDNLHGDSRLAELELSKEWPDPNIKLGQVSAVSVDTKGNVFIFHRADRIWDMQTFSYDDKYTERNRGPIQQNTVIVLNATSGQIIEEWGSNKFFLPHGLTVDSENNVWVTDVALHQVFKFSSNRDSVDKPSLLLGEEFIPGNDDNHFCKPTDVAILSNGDFFVSDGYCNSRIIKFNKKGKKLMEWGRRILSIGSLLRVKPLPNHFLVPHSVAVAEEKEMLFVADRENGRVQCFNSSSGVYITQIYSEIVGPRIFSVSYAPVQGGLLYLVNGPSLVGRTVKVQGFVLSLTSNNIIAQFNGDGKGFQNPHDVAVTPDGCQVFAVELNPHKVWKFVQGNGNISTLAKGDAAQSITLENITSNVMTPFQMKLNPSTTKDDLKSSAFTGNSFAASVGIIASVIIILIIVGVVAVLRIRRGHLLRYSSHPSRWDFNITSAEGFKLGQFLDRHQGFEKVSTEESDDEGSSNNDLQSSAQYA